MVFAALVALVNGTLVGDAPLPGWPTHRLPHDVAGYCGGRLHRGTNLKEAWFACPMKGDCEDNAKGSKLKLLMRGESQGCVLDYNHPNGMRLTFVWHAMSNPSSWRTTTRTLSAVLGNSTRAPDLTFLGIGAWDMLFGGGSIWDVRSERTVKAAYELALQSLRALWNGSAHANGSNGSNGLRIAYGNWLCKESGFSWRSRYSRGTQMMRDWYRERSVSDGWLWLDVQRTQDTLPAISTSPCGNQHAFGVLAETHALAMLAAAAPCLQRMHEIMAVR